VCVKSGEAAPRDIDLAAAEPSIATDEFVVVLDVSSDLLGRTESVSRRGGVALDRHPDEGRRLLLFVGMLALGLLAPLLLMFLLNQLAASVKRLGTHRVAQVAITHSDSRQTIRPADGRDKLMTAADFEFDQVQINGRRSASVGVLEMNASAGFNPFRVPRIKVSRPGGGVTGFNRIGDNRVQVSLDADSVWLVEADQAALASEDDEIEIVLYAFSQRQDGTIEGDIASLVAAVGSAGAARVTSLRRWAETAEIERKAEMADDEDPADPGTGRQEAGIASRPKGFWEGNEGQEPATGDRPPPSGWVDKPNTSDTDRPPGWGS
jgi:hypothetical protein